MRLRNVPGAKEAVENSPYVIGSPEQSRGRWRGVFGNDRPVRLEIGMGKGRFLRETARLHPEINFLGLEKFSSAMIRAVRGQEAEPLANLLFLRMEAEILTEVFAPGEIERIYLNFSDPWPKKRHAHRRLPSRDFLRRYERVLTKGGTVEFKTDNRALFDYALEELAAAGWCADAVTYDLHADERMRAGNVTTEYEERFSARGNPICKYIARPDGAAQEGTDEKENTGY